MSDSLVLNLPPPENYALSLGYGFWLQESSSERWIELSNNYIQLALNPQSIGEREPVATQITFTQGGGKFIESRGGLVKMFVFAGTTGHLPITTRATVLLGSPTPSRDTKLVKIGGLESLVDQSVAAEQARQDKSGFMAFHKLRQLFRRFMELRKQGRTDVFLHYLNFKDDEYWKIEPSEFALNRDSKRPFTYQYQIMFQGVEPIEITPTEKTPWAPINRQTPAQQARPMRPEFRPFVIPLYNPVRSLWGSAMALLQAINDFTMGLQRMVQHLLNYVNDLTTLLDTVRGTFQTLLDAPLNMLRMIDNSLTGLWTAVEAFSSTSVKNEINAWLVDMKLITAHIKATVIATFPRTAKVVPPTLSSAFSSSRHQLGSTTDQIKPASPAALQAAADDLGLSLGSTDVDPTNSPYGGDAGLDLVTNQAQLENLLGLRADTVNHGETIFDVARRTLGSVQRFIDLVLINHLDVPYIVDDPNNKPPNTLAWGERIQIPGVDDGSGTISGTGMEAPPPSFSGAVTHVVAADKLKVAGETWRTDQWAGFTVTMMTGTSVGTKRVVVANDAEVLTLNLPLAPPPAVGEEFTVNLEEFDILVMPSPETRAYGRDILLDFHKGGSGPALTADIVFTTCGDLAMAQGFPNFFQALMIRMSTELGRHTFHPEYGVPMPVGRPWDGGLVLLYTYLARQSLLSDPRVQTVRPPLLSFEGGTTHFEMEVQPVNAAALYPIKT